MYKLLRRLFFLLDAETAHHLAMNSLRVLCSVAPVRALLRRLFRPKDRPLQALGRQFRNPVGLGAGFDKNARYLRELEVLGFGFVEIGTATPRPQAGNEKPRLFRLPQDGALINRMGFNNDGVEAIAGRLKKWREKTYRNGNEAGPRMLVGGNIGKNKTTPNEDAWKDYITCFSALHPYVDFFVVNVSSPNTPGLRALQERDALHGILTRLQQLNDSSGRPLPLLLKIAPDLSDTQLDEVVDLALEIGLDGLVASNTTISRDGLQRNAAELEAIGAGGLSGRPLRERSTAVLLRLAKRSGGRLLVIGSGGIFSAADAQEKLDAGARLVEVWTGFIYEGPMIAKNICAGLK